MTFNEKTQGAGMCMEDFGGSVGMGILWVFPRIFLWVWDGYGD